MLFSKGESISRLVLALQAQLDSLVTHMELSNEIHISPGVAIDPALPRQSAAREGLGSAIPPPRETQINVNPTSTPNPPTVAVANMSKPSTRRFYGPTSPDYSLNAATIKLRLAQAPTGGPTVPEETNPSLEDDHTDDDTSAMTTTGTATMPAATTGPTAGGAASAASSQASEAAAAATQTGAASAVGSSSVSLLALVMAFFAL